MTEQQIQDAVLRVIILRDERYGLGSTIKTIHRHIHKGGWIGTNCIEQDRSVTLTDVANAVAALRAKGAL